MKRMAVGVCVVVLIGVPGLANAQIPAACGQPEDAALQGLADTGVEAERVRELLQAAAREQGERRQRHRELVSANGSVDDLAELLRDTDPAGSAAAVEGHYRELSRLLRRNPPRPRTAEYDLRLEGVLAVQSCLGVPRDVLDYTVEIVREAADQAYPAAAIQEYFAAVDRLDVDAPDDSDARTWRFLARQDILEQLLTAVAATGTEAASALSWLASDLEILNPEAAARLQAVADFLQQQQQRRPRVFRWAAGGMSDPEGFSRAAAPVTVYEFGQYIAWEPLLAAAAAELRQRFRHEQQLFRFFTNAMRVGLQQGQADIYQGDPESSQPQLLNPEYLREYERHAEGVVNQLDQYSRSNERSWRTDPQRRADFMGNRLVQQGLRTREDVPELLRDTVREWLGGARITTGRPVEIPGLPFAQTVVLAEPGRAAERLQAARAAWLREDDPADSQRDDETVLEWFALHGLVVVPAEPDDPVWHAEPYVIAAAGAEQLAYICDRMLYRSGFSDTFLHIAEVEFAVRIASLRQYYIHEELTRRLLQQELGDLEAMQRYRALWTYQQGLAELLRNLDSRLAELPSLLPAAAPAAYLDEQLGTDDAGATAGSDGTGGVNGPWMQDHALLQRTIGAMEGKDGNE